MAGIEEWTCFEFGLPYLLYQLEGPIEFTYGGVRCRVDLARHERVPGSKTMSIVDDPFGRTDYTGVRLCFEGLRALSLEDMSPEDEQRIDLEKRFGRNAAREYEQVLHRFLISAVNALIDAYAFAWGAWRLPPIQFVDLTGYSAYHVIGDKRSGKLIRSLQPDPDKGMLEKLKNALTTDDRAGSVVRFFGTSGPLKTFWQLETAAVRALFRRDTLATEIMCVTALEVYVDAVLSERLQAMGLSIDTLRKLLKVSSKSQAATVTDILDLARLEHKLKKGLYLALNIRLAQRSVWDRWIQTYKMRNDAAHDGIAPSVEAAGEGIITVREMVEAIDKAVTHAA